MYDRRECMGNVSTFLSILLLNCSKKKKIKSLRIQWWFLLQVAGSLPTQRLQKEGTTLKQEQEEKTDLVFKHDELDLSVLYPREYVH